MRIVGADHSLTSTGLAFVRAGEIVKLHTITSAAVEVGETLEQRTDRIAIIARRFGDELDEFDDADPLVLVIETRDFQIKARAKGSGGHATDRAGLWVQLLVVARMYRAHLVGVAPSALKVWATGDGRASKTAVQDAVEQTYGVRCRNNDEGDALALASMAAHHYGTPLGPVGPAQLRAKQPRWPAINGTTRRT